MKYEDYYKVLGVVRTASQKEIQQAYRKLARQFHPDINKAKDAEARFKQVNEANEVLGDPEKRKKYDELGADWQSGQEFRPPPGWAGQGGQGGRPRTRGGAHADGQGFHFEGGNFSDFFEQMFGGRGGNASARDIFGNMGGGMGGQPGDDEGHTQESELPISLEDAYHGATKGITLRDPADGSTRNLQVKIPAGATDGTVIRLAGQGGRSHPGGPAGDLRLKLRLAAHDRFKVEGHDLVLTLNISPWEAALGAKVSVATLDGSVTLTLPPGSQSGQRLRLKERGLPQRGGARGDLYAVLRVAVPKPLSDVERRLFEELQKESKFDPRA
ncbi:MAG: J domain-containing protein [Planctomycetota bacterium]|nr:J domain-containing protein [Planctomycetota bacterium]